MGPIWNWGQEESESELEEVSESEPQGHLRLLKDTRRSLRECRLDLRGRT